MKYEGLELWRLDLALRRPVGTSAGTHGARPVVLVHVVADGADGWGSAVPWPTGRVSTRHSRTVWRALVGHGAARLATAARARDGELPPAAVVAQLFDTTPTSRMVVAALEMAVLDAELRAAGRSLADRLGVPPDAQTAGATAGAVVGIPSNREIGVLVDDVGRLVDAGFERVRLKIEPGWDVAPVAAVRRAFPTLAIQVDANGAYRLTTATATATGTGSLAVPTDVAPTPTPANDARRLVALDELDVVCIEQPLPPATCPPMPSWPGSWRRRSAWTSRWGRSGRSTTRSATARARWRA